MDILGFLCYDCLQRTLLMKSIFVDTQTFLKNPKFYVNIMHEFGSSITKEAMLTTLEHNCFYFFAFDDKGKVF